MGEKARDESIEEFDFDQESFYICMNCQKIYDENPQKCFDPDGKVHSEYVDMAKFLGGHPQVRSYETYQSILRFDIGQIENLDFVTGMGNTNLEKILNKKGFKTLEKIDNSGNYTREQEDIKESHKRLEEDALILASNLNTQGEKYFVFSNSYIGGYARYTFMKKGL